MAAVFTSIDELLEGATERRPLKTSDSKSGASFERVVIDGRPHIVKYLHPDDDWIMRVSGDLVCRPAVVWSSGLLDHLPASIDHAMVGVATGLGRNQWGIALLMRDVSDWLVPEGDQPVSLEQHLAFIDHMA
ncbi:MAG: aminoglycoside phosphotransferase, partial [Acidobacteria bacterium]|nr:aminoglycoside phosphotransferase [Acidobacteriota bacterium]